MVNGIYEAKSFEINVRSPGRSSYYFRHFTDIVSAIESALTAELRLKEPTSITLKATDIEKCC